MSKKVSGHVPAGGPSSSRVKQVTLKTGSPNRAVNPAYASQLGQKFGYPEGIAKPDAGKALPSRLGNEVAKNVGSGGPGRGRTLYGQSGSQSQHGPSNPGSPRPEGQDINSSFPGKPNNNG